MPDDAVKELGVAILSEEWDASTAHERPDALLATKPRPTARLDHTGINHRQATLRRLRDARAFSQFTSAELLDTDPPDVSGLERRSHVRLSALKRFAKVTRSEIYPIFIFTGGNTAELTGGEEQ